ncbi:MAG: methyltransferase domain-containing protein [Phycisphaera sp.]|nr:methyltransferase domain-containing protein [Phycisphaera sp.]
MSPDYQYQDEGSGHHHAYLLPAVRQMLEASGAREEKLFDCGCGNGSFGNRLAGEGWNVTGVDPSEDGIRIAQGNYPDIRVETGSTEEDLSARFGTFPVVISLEVVEHVYAPKEYMARIYDLVEPGGSVILSTPYHGYLKNLAIAVTGKWDHHHTVLWDDGHIKFWSVATLSQLLVMSGFTVREVARVGRMPALAKSMVIRAVKAG